MGDDGSSRGVSSREMEMSIKIPQGIPGGKIGEKDRKIGHRRVDVTTGHVTYKKIETSTICGSIQLGIGHAISSLASKPERDILMIDFATIETTNFIKEGTKTTPAHHYSDFKFKSYAPVAFRYFRDMFGIRPEDFLVSFCSEPLRELSNPGASGSVFYLTFDDEFIIKTVQHKEAEFLQKLLPGYYMNLNQNPRTLLPKFFGLYCYICGGKNVRTCVMNNLLPTSIRMHEKYDLKGSTYKRKANKHERTKSSPTYKDLDFMELHPEGLLLEAETYNALIKTLQRDCRVLESFQIMDYSLLVGVHNLDVAAKEKAEGKQNKHKEFSSAPGSSEKIHQIGSNSNAAAATDTSSDKPRTFSMDSDTAVSTDDKSMTGGTGIISAAVGAAGTSAAIPVMATTSTNLTRSKSINKTRLAAYSTAMESIQAEAEPIDEEDDVPPGGIPARNSKGERLLLFLGVIDILQSYRLKKKVEHTLKSMFTDGDTVSVHRPSFYAQRFLDFMAKTVFRKIPSLDLPEIKGPHRKFRTLVSSFMGMALKPHSPSKTKRQTIPRRIEVSKGTSSSGAGILTAAALLGTSGSASGGEGSSESPRNLRKPLPSTLHHTSPSHLRGSSGGEGVSSGFSGSSEMIALNQIEMDTHTVSVASTSGHSSIRSGSTVVDNSWSIIPEHQTNTRGIQGYSPETTHRIIKSSSVAEKNREAKERFLSSSPGVKEKRRLHQIHLDDDDETDTTITATVTSDATHDDDYHNDSDENNSCSRTKPVQFITSL